MGRRVMESSECLYLDLQRKDGGCQTFQIDFSDEEQVTSLVVHLEETALVACAFVCGQSSVRDVVGDEATNAAAKARRRQARVWQRQSSSCRSSCRSRRCSRSRCRSSPGPGCTRAGQGVGQGNKQTAASEEGGWASSLISQIAI